MGDIGRHALDDAIGAARLDEDDVGVGLAGLRGLATRVLLYEQVADDTDENCGRDGCEDEEDSPGAADVKWRKRSIADARDEARRVLGVEEVRTGDLARSAPAGGNDGGHWTGLANDQRQRIGRVGAPYATWYAQIVVCFFVWPAVTLPAQDMTTASARFSRAPSLCDAQGTPVDDRR